MLQVELRDNETDRSITTVSMTDAPRVGELLWLQPKRHNSAFKVECVAHWVSDMAKYHRVCVYVSAV